MPVYHLQMYLQHASGETERWRVRFVDGKAHCKSDHGLTPEEIREVFFLGPVSVPTAVVVDRLLPDSDTAMNGEILDCSDRCLIEAYFRAGRSSLQIRRRATEFADHIYEVLSSQGAPR
ncbi:hypothetical protein DFR29_10220 [Tahibacter aquaticus]|uniref:Uncharacterized protein n=1 Tax=Tahibacter aquaticus TaxID=520092 RepID=A0A4R6Z6I3_9GAMM|nr:hypothetical protein [Tahibacter aquaticus]TDR47361.1 hypothetical protein DFR29_10220 [Tahibacter aquaticus]